ncbi:MAG TPA: hypothetical protein VK166_12860 [Chitinophagaceae bacterium]|nr:hypothetical protein [Chitinophagaceae bacterium]
MDKRISTLIFIYVIYLVIALAMVFSTQAQKVITMILWGAGGILIFFVFFFLWLVARKD